MTRIASIPACSARGFVSVPFRSLAVFVVACLALVFGGPALAQDEPETPYAGTIAFDTVEARSGAGRVFYPVATLKQGERVTVVDNFFGWHRVEAPSGVVAAVRQVDVEAKGTGGRGVVTADIATVRVLGLERDAAESFKTLKTLRKGDTVAILERDGDYFRIKPPAGSLVFLKPGSVEAIAGQPEFDATEFDTPEDTAPPTPTEVVEGDTTATPAVAAVDDMVPVEPVTGTDTTGTDEPDAGSATADAATDTADTEVAEVAEAVENASETAAANADRLPDLNDPGTAPAVATAVATELPEESPAGSGVDAADSTDPATAITDAAQIAETPEEIVIETPAVNAALREVEMAMLPHFYKPVEQQPLEEMQAAYEDVRNSQELAGVDARIIDARMTAIERNRQFAAALVQIRQRQEAVPRVEPIKVEPDDNEPYAAIGELSVSTVLGGDAGTLFRVVDPATRRTIAYLRPAAGVDPAPKLGQIVGVRGDRQYDPSLNNQLIIVQQVRVLDGGS